jgi:hypothetical protein
VETKARGDSPWEMGNKMVSDKRRRRMREKERDRKMI